MKGTAPTLVREMFALNEENRYKLRNRADFTILTVNSVRWTRRFELFKIRNLGNVTVRLKANQIIVKISC